MEEGQMDVEGHHEEAPGPAEAAGSGGSPVAAAAALMSRQESSGEALLAGSEQGAQQDPGSSTALPVTATGDPGTSYEADPPAGAATDEHTWQAGSTHMQIDGQHGPPGSGYDGSGPPEEGEHEGAQQQQHSGDPAAQQQQQDAMEQDVQQQQAADPDDAQQQAAAGMLASPPGSQQQQADADADADALQSPRGYSQGDGGYGGGDEDEYGQGGYDGMGEGDQDGEQEGELEAHAAAAAAAHQAQLEQQQKLNELEAVLRQPDAVMEPGIMERLREYVMANGHPQAAVEHLTDSYVGYAQMASLVCRWLKMTEPDGGPTGATTAGGPATAPGMGAPGGGPGALRGSGAAAGLGLGLEATAGGGRHQAHQQQRQQQQELDEAFYLRQLAKERFDPQLFTTVFTSGNSRVPQWLNGLISEPEGRSLVYELAGRYKNSLLLNFAIHKILMQPGREKEVAAVGGSLAGYFGVFHRLMAAKLREAAAAGDEAELAVLARGLKEDCCASQHTYVHAQQVLCELAKHPNGARFRRMAQEVEEHAAALHGPVVWKMRQWFAEPDQPELHYQAAGLLSDILASSVSGAPPASEMSKLYRLYFPQEPGQQPPPISFLRHPRVFEVLLQGLFSPGRQLQPEAVAAYSGLLALAAAADDRRPASPAAATAAAEAGAAAAENGTAGGGGEEGQQGAAGVGGSGATGFAGSDGTSSSSQQQQQQLFDLSAVPATREALEAAAELAQRVMQDQKSSPEEMEAAAAVLEYPCCAAGILRAMGAQLTRPEYWQTAYHLLKSPPFLTLLSLLVPRQPPLHASLLQLLGRTLTALGNANHDMAKAFLSIAVQLVSAGRVFEVLRWAEEWKQRADPSLVRHLVFGILEVSAPPYSPDFAGSMLRIMMAAGIRRERLSARDWAIKALLDEFAAACAQVQFKPPLSAREAQFLQDISADRPPGY